MEGFGVGFIPQVVLARWPASSVSGAGTPSRSSPTVGPSPSRRSGGAGAGVIPGGGRSGRWLEVCVKEEMGEDARQNTDWARIFLFPHGIFQPNPTFALIIQFLFNFWYQFVMSLHSKNYECLLGCATRPEGVGFCGEQMWWYASITSRHTTSPWHEGFNH